MQVSEQSMREQIAEELADIIQRQKVIVQCNEALGLLTSNKVEDTFKTMAEEDVKNLHMLESVFVNLGAPGEARESSVRNMTALAYTVVDQGAGPIEKLGAYILLKQNQIMCCHLLHKSSQVVPPDMKLPLGQLDGVYAAFTQHVISLNTFMENSAVEWITGQKAKTGLLGRVRDAMATVAGHVMSKTAKPADMMDVIPVLEMDHRKAEALFKEIENASDRQQAFELFHQLKADLTVHSIAEEETVYRRFENMEGLTEILEDAQQEHEDLRFLLDEITDIAQGGRDTETFRKKVEDLKNLVMHHVREEENQALPKIKANTSEEERIKLSSDFMRSKAKILENIGTGEVVSTARKNVREADATA